MTSASRAQKSLIHLQKLLKVWLYHTHVHARTRASLTPPHPGRLLCLIERPNQLSMAFHCLRRPGGPRTCTKRGGWTRAEPGCRGLIFSHQAAESGAQQERRKQNEYSSSVSASRCSPTATVAAASPVHAHVSVVAPFEPN